MEREQQLLEAAMRYQTLLDQEQTVNVREFVAAEPADLRSELIEYLELLLVTDQPSFSPLVLAEEQAFMDRMTLRAQERLQQRMVAATAPAPTLSALRKARKLTPSVLARQINLPVDLWQRIERGGVQAATLPPRLIARLAIALQQAEATIQATLTLPPLSASVQLSAQDATMVAPEQPVSFAEALEASTATDVQKAEWT